MFVKTKNGKTKQGFTLKDCNGSGILYVYVWNKFLYDAEHVKEKRKKAKEKGKDYGKANGWRCLGRLDNPSTMNELKLHLQNMYGDDFIEEEKELYAYFREQRELLERKRIEEVNTLWAELQTLAEEKGIDIKRIPQTVNGLKKKLKTLRDQ